MSDVLSFIKIGEVGRPSTYVKPPKPPPPPKTHHEASVRKAQVDLGLVSDATITAAATATAAAWMAHPANKMQLPSLQKQHDTDGDGVISKEEFAQLLKAAGSSAGASALFEAMDKDGDGNLTEEEIKMLGQEASARVR